MAQPPRHRPQDGLADEMRAARQAEFLPFDAGAQGQNPDVQAQDVQASGDQAFNFNPDLTRDDLTPDDLTTAKMQFFLALRSRGVTDPRVLAAMEKVDRGLFVRGLFTSRTYEDVPLPIACGQTISQPSVVGLMTQAAEITPRDVVLEVGTGSGYQAAILSHLARRVYTLDRHRRLVGEAQALFDHLGLINITAMTADGCFGLAGSAPFDRIIVTAAAEDPPSPLMAQLKEGGIMIVPVGQSDAVQSLIKVTRTAHGFDYEELRPVRFVPLVEGVGTT